MKYFIFDTEDTGLGTKDEVVQFSGFLVDEECRLQRLYNFYCYPLVEFQQKAQQVTGLNKEILMELSKGRFFEEQFYEYKTLLNEKNITWVGYNVSFDTRLINQTLKANGYPVHNFGRKVGTLANDYGTYNFDVLDVIASTYNKGIRLKLGAAVDKYCSKTLEQIQKEYVKIMQYAKINSEITFHNAIFDAYATYCLFKDIFWVFRD